MIYQKTQIIRQAFKFDKFECALNCEQRKKCFSLPGQVDMSITKGWNSKKTINQIGKKKLNYSGQL